MTKSQRTRLIIGATVLISGFLSPLLIPFVLESGLSTSMVSVLSGLLAFGIPELFMILAVSIMGKSGYQYFKAKAMKLLTVISPQKVSRTRHFIGSLFFAIPIILGFLQPYLAHYFPVFEQIPLGWIITTDLMLLLSLFILGGEFWEKLNGLFLYDIIAVKRTLNNT
ncbi:MAG: hypothetical protein WBN59_14755 [Flavobacteriaceae bacterium]